MLTAHANTTADDFVAQLRTYVIAMGLSQAVVDCVDNLVSANELEEAQAAELEEVEDHGRENMKEEILDKVNKWLENQPDYETIAAPCEALIREIEKITI